MVRHAYSSESAVRGTDLAHTDGGGVVLQLVEFLGFEVTMLVNLSGGPPWHQPIAQQLAKGRGSVAVLVIMVHFRTPLGEAVSHRVSHWSLKQPLLN